MKKFIRLGSIRFVPATVFLLIGGILHAQNRPKDKAAINKQIDAMIYSWNNHNYDDMKNYTTKNIDWVNGVGMWWKAQKESQYAHQAYHKTIFKESVMEKKFVAIRLKERKTTHMIFWRPWFM
ncbi:hypothetical protein [Terrimonas alba]|uniref:hypothetical protein n=1 Tax=Terrimonas alba TaxID=3349636 RepID=UPI0035F2AA9E